MNTNSSDQDWNRCAPGEVGRLVAELKTARRGRLLRGRAVQAGVAGVIVLVVGFVGLRLLPAETLKPISCHKLREFTQQIIADSLNGPIGERIRRHLLNCRGCRDHIARVRGDSARQRTQVGAEIAGSRFTAGPVGPFSDTGWTLTRFRPSTPGR